jgi:hypothetical protein
MASVRAAHGDVCVCVVDIRRSGEHTDCIQGQVFWCVHGRSIDLEGRM